MRRFLCPPPDAVEATDTALKFDLLTAYVDGPERALSGRRGSDFVTGRWFSTHVKAPNAKKMRQAADDAPADGAAWNMLCNRRLTHSWRATAVASVMEVPMKAMQFCSLAAFVTVARWLSVTLKEGSRNGCKTIPGTERGFV